MPTIAEDKLPKIAANDIRIAVVIVLSVVLGFIILVGVHEAVHALESKLGAATEVCILGWRSNPGWFGWVDGEQQYLDKDENVPLAIGVVACISVSIPLAYFLGIGYLPGGAKELQGSNHAKERIQQFQSSMSCLRCRSVCEIFVKSRKQP